MRQQSRLAALEQPSSDVHRARTAKEGHVTKSNRVAVPFAATGEIAFAGVSAKRQDRQREALAASSSSASSLTQSNSSERPTLTDNANETALDLERTEESAGMEPERETV